MRVSMTGGFNIDPNMTFHPVYKDPSPSPPPEKKTKKTNPDLGRSGSMSPYKPYLYPIPSAAPIPPVKKQRLNLRKPETT